MGVATMNSVPAAGLPVESPLLPVTHASGNPRMLHVSLRSGQICARPWLAAVTLALLVALTAPAFSQEGAAAEALVQSGRHLEAAAQYEKLARRGFLSWNVDYLLLAAREYGAAGEFDDAERLLAKARDRVREPEERLLAVRVEAEIALARGDAARALGAFRGLPDPLPEDIAPDLLALRARAEFSVGMTVQGLRTLEERGALLVAPAARTANDKFLLDQLLLHPPTFQVMPPGLSERERGWLELAVLLPASRDPLRQGDPSVTGGVRDWALRHPGHPGTPFLPGADAFSRGAGLAALPSAPPATIAVLLPLSGKASGRRRCARWYRCRAGSPRVRLPDDHDCAFDSSPGAVAAYERAPWPRGATRHRAAAAEDVVAWSMHAGVCCQCRRWL
jgi:outer membrane PBP1 activator LpoA protein